MSRETKIGLLVGLGFILFLGILVNDHFAQANRGSFVDFTEDGQPAGIDPGPYYTPHAAPQRGGSMDTAPTPRLDSGQQDREQARPVLRPAPQGERWEIYRTQATASPGGVRFEGLSPEDQPRQSARTVQPQGDLIYHVKRGDTLGEIASRFLGSSSKWRLIVDANRDRIPDPDRLAVGTRLVIPRQIESAAPVAQAQGTGEPVPVRLRQGETVYGQYTVKPGETLSELAQRFLGSAAKWRELHRLNHDRISNPDRLKPGTVIRVPHRTS